MKTNIAPGELDQTPEKAEPVDQQKNESAPDDGLWAGMMTASVFGGKLFPKES